MTNFERIKNMSVEELAPLLFSSCTEYMECKFKTETCKQCVVNWLNSESEEE